ncbi:MAG: flagellar basal body rod protein FlgB [Christensenellales bacterium]|jgi:flagellar basal-body rod protein FlgB
MLNDAFGGINLLQKGLDAAWTRNSVITNNIANVDTPGFKSSKVEFEDALKRAMEADSGGFKAKTTREKHIDFTGSAEQVKPAIVTNSNSNYRADGNNVDIDYESVELARNTYWYYALIEQISSEFAKLKTVING